MNSNKNYNFHLSEKVISGLTDIQNNYETLVESLRIIEDYIIDYEPANEDPPKTLDAIRQVRILKSYIREIFPLLK